MFHRDAPGQEPDHERSIAGSGNRANARELYLLAGCLSR